MSYQPEYFVSPRAPGVRPADPPNYDGITFVYLFTYVVDPWVVPGQLQNVVLVVENAQGFLAGMSIIIEGAGSFQVVSTDALNRMTVQNLGYSQNAAPGTGIAPGKITTTSLPGPKGDQGFQGIAGAAATVTAGTTTTTPAGQNATVVNSGTPNAAVFDFNIPRGPTGPQGAQGAPGQAYNNVTTAAFTAANPPTVQPLSLSNTTGLAAGVTLNINPIGYYNVTGVISGTQVNVVNAGVATNAAAGTLSPSGSAVLGTGPQGAPGNAATIAVGTTTTGAPGTNASVNNSGDQHAAVFNFTVPQGPIGAQGPVGPTGSSGTPGTAGTPGTSATVAVGTTTTGAPGSNAVVTNTGTASAAVFNFTVPQGVAGAIGPQGAQGAAGSPGAAGTAATVAVGTTSTGLPGTNASVTNSGSSSAAIFSFTIPRGDVGAAGPVGPAGATGPAGPTGPTGPAGPGIPPGVVWDFAGSSIPSGWLLCDGSNVSRTTYANLYSAIGTTYGAGDGSTTFALPDCRGRMIVGVGQGSGLTNRTLALIGGEEAHVLTVTELAAHNHGVNDPQHNHTQSAHGHGFNDPQHTHTIVLTSATNGQSGAGITYMWPSGSYGMSSNATGCSVAAANANINAAATGITTQNNGSGGGHNTMAPFIALNKIIKT